MWNTGDINFGTDNFRGVAPLAPSWYILSFFLIFFVFLFLPIIPFASPLVDPLATRVLVELFFFSAIFRKHNGAVANPYLSILSPIKRTIQSEYNTNIHLVQKLSIRFCVSLFVVWYNSLSISFFLLFFFLSCLSKCYVHIIYVYVYVYVCIYIHVKRLIDFLPLYP